MTGMTGIATRYLRVFEPHPGLYAYYDGRVPGHRFMVEDNWVDGGAIGLGIATYALVEGEAALIYDTHVSPEHGHAIRKHLEGLGVTDFTVIYSHWHLDHVAGTEAFTGCEVIANTRTAAHLMDRKDVIESGAYHGPPAITPLILPTRTFSGQMELSFGRRRIVLIELNIHSDDATVMWLPDERILLAGDTVEDPLTYVAEPADFAIHLRDLERLVALKPKYVLPDHGAQDVLERGGYGPGVIPAMQRYIRWLMSLKMFPECAEQAPEDILGSDITAGTLIWFEPYRAVHILNVTAALKQFGHA